MIKFKFHTGDEMPRLVFQIIDHITSESVNLSAPTTDVTVYVREWGGDENVVEAPCTKIGTGFTGQAMVVWPTGAWDNLDPGVYECQIVIDFDGTQQTVDEHFGIVLLEGFVT